MKTFWNAMNSNARLRNQNFRLSWSKEWGMCHFNHWNHVCFYIHKVQTLYIVYSLQNLVSVFTVFCSEKKLKYWEFIPLCSLTLLGVILALEHLSSITAVVRNRKFSATKFPSAICICCWTHRLQFHFNRRKTVYLTCKCIPFSAYRERTKVDFLIVIQGNIKRTISTRM